MSIYVYVYDAGSRLGRTAPCRGARREHPRAWTK